MAKRKRFLIVAGVSLAAVAAMCYGVRRRDERTTYEIQPYIWTPEYRTDAARAIDAYERLMERHMDVTEANLIGIGSDVRLLSRKLDAIDGRLKELSVRIARIEQALQIAPAGDSAADQSAGESAAVGAQTQPGRPNTSTQHRAAQP